MPPLLLSHQAVQDNRPQLKNGRSASSLRPCARPGTKWVYGILCFWTASCCVHPASDWPECCPGGENILRSVCVDLTTKFTESSQLPELCAPSRLSDLRVNTFFYISEASYRAVCASLPPNDRSPLLQPLHIYFTQRTPPRLAVPSHLLTGAARILSHLVLQYCAVDWDTLLHNHRRECEIANLLTLHLVDVHPPPPNDILNVILSSSPNLLSLNTEGIFREDFVPSSQWSPPSFLTTSFRAIQAPAKRRCSRVYRQVTPRIQDFVYRYALVCTNQQCTNTNHSTPTF